MSSREHWDHIYETKPQTETSWYIPHLTASVHMIRAATPNRAASIIDIGGGVSTLAEDLVAEGFRDVTVLDVSSRAIEKCRARLGASSDTVQWIVGDVLSRPLGTRQYDVWHDRAAFHFLIEPEQRHTYVGQLRSAMKPGGHVILATFGPDGPERCSGLTTRRYDARGLQRELEPGFQLRQSLLEEHRTPFGAAQQFLYCHFDWMNR